MYLPAREDVTPYATFGGIGLAVGLVGGVFVAIFTGLTLGLSLLVGVLGGTGLGVGGYWFATRNVDQSDEDDDFEDDEDDEDNSTLRTNLYSGVFGLILGVAVGLVIKLDWYRIAPDAKNWQTNVAVVLYGGLACLLTTRLIQQHYEHQANSRQQTIDRGDNNFLGNKLDRFLYLLGEDETRIDLAERPPIAEGLARIGFTFQVTCLALWVYWRCTGWEWIRTNVSEADPLVMTTLVVGGPILLFWATASILELVVIRERPEQKAEINKTLKKWLRRAELVFTLVMIGGLWYVTGWPLRQWFWQSFQENPTNLSLLVAVPCGLLTILLWISYLESGTILSNEVLHNGTKLLFLPGMSMRQMPRREMANFDVQKGPVRFLASYWRLKSEGKGQYDAEFQNMRIKHGNELSELLPRKT